jgi:outer membrane biosynthesis protein TonB
MQQPQPAASQAVVTPNAAAPPQVVPQPAQPAAAPTQNTGQPAVATAPTATPAKVPAASDVNKGDAAKAPQRYTVIVVLVVILGSINLVFLILFFRMPPNSGITIRAPADVVEHFWNDLSQRKFLEREAKRPKSASQAAQNGGSAEASSSGDETKPMPMRSKYAARVPAKTSNAGIWRSSHNL